MYYHIEKLPGKPIIIAALQADFKIANDWEEFISKLMALLDDQPEPVFYISDLRQASFSFDDLLTGTNLATRGSSAVLKHPNVRENLVITTSSMLKLAAKGLNSVTFGNIDVKVFDSVEEALAYCQG